MLYRSLNLFLALLWLLIGSGLLVLDWRRGTPTLITIGGTPISLGWIALFLAGYNIVRWWFIRSSFTSRQQAEHRERLQRRHEHRPPQEPDPNFMFTDTPGLKEKDKLSDSDA